VRGRVINYHFRNDVTGWRARPIFGALRLRAPRGDHTRAEAGVIAAAVKAASNVVEIGAFEGGGSTLIRASMTAGGTLTVVDPYPRGRLGFSAPLVTAKLLARRQREVATRWLRTTSLDAAQFWAGELDAVVIDGVHTLDAVREDWSAWARFVRLGGVVVARNDVVAEAGSSSRERSTALLGAAPTETGTWEVTECADSFAVFHRRLGDTRTPRA
jgi:predicted O-methyltransferase YrrM